MSVQRQSFLVDLADVALLQAVGVGGKPVTYISIGAGDASVWEYLQVARTMDDLLKQNALPILYRSMRPTDVLSTAQSGTGR